MTPLPVFGVPVEIQGAVGGRTACCSIVQMPAGIPVGTLAIGRAGAVNAALLAAAVLALSDAGAGRASRCLARRADGEGRRRAVRRRMTDRRCSGRARRSASSAAASSAACWRWPPRGSATAPSCWSRRPTARPRRWRTGRSSPPMTTRQALAELASLSDVVDLRVRERAGGRSGPRWPNMCRVSPPAKALRGQRRTGWSKSASSTASASPRRTFCAVDSACRPGRGAVRLRRQRRAEDPPLRL